MANIRLATTGDAAAVAGIYAPYCEGSAVSFEQVAPWWKRWRSALPPSSHSARGSCSRTTARSSGYAYAGPHNERWAYRWSVNTAIYISRTHQRRGAGRALYTALFDLLRRLGYYQAIAGITLPNPASVGLHEAMGFELAGVYRDIGYKLGAWRDVGVVSGVDTAGAARTIGAACDRDAARNSGMAHYFARD